jgi:hypothetical protein
MSDLQINTRVRRLFHYLEDFERGVIRIPAFQRDFVWTTQKKVELFDSIKRGYPIGSILFWRPFHDEIATNSDWATNQIGAYTLPERTTDYLYILDGYQRLSTLFGCLVNPLNTKLIRDDKLWEKEFNLVYNLEEDLIKHKKGINYKIYEIPLYELADGGGFFEFQTKLFSQKDLEESTIKLYKDRYKAFSRRLSSYDLASIDMIGGEMEEAIDIFTRLNSSGAEIKDEWKLSALSFSISDDFRLGTEIDKLLNDLNRYNFNKLKRKIVYQCITSAFSNDPTAKTDIKELKRLSGLSHFVETTRKTIKSIQRAVQFLYGEVYVLESRLLPYNNQLVFMVDFFNKVENPTQNQIEILKGWFWFTTYSNYFTNYNIGEQREAYQVFQQFIEDEKCSPIYIGKKLENIGTLEFPSKINFKSVRAKALTLFLLQYQLSNKEEETSLMFYKRKLFRNTKGVESDLSENIICMAILPSDFSIIKKMDFLDGNLLNEKDDLLFITDEVKNLSLLSEKETLDERKKIIESAEKEFVENYVGIDYTI